MSTEEQAKQNPSGNGSASKEKDDQTVLLAKIAAHLERQTVEQSRQSKKLDDLHAEIHYREAPKRSMKIENAGIRKHVEILEDSSANFDFLGQVLFDHASGAAPLSHEHAANLAEKCDQGKQLCKDRIQYHEECDRLGFDIAKELLSLRERGKREPVDLALEEKTIKLVSKRQNSKPDKSSEKPAKKANMSSAPAPTFQPPWYSHAPVFQPVPSPFPPALASIPQPRPYRQYRPSTPSYPSQFSSYPFAYPNFPPMAPSAPFSAPSIFLL
jgi:hypothetical protein